MYSPQTMIYIGRCLLVTRLVACIPLDSDVDRLVNDLKANYSRYARPPRNQNEPLTVAFEFNLFAIREFDEIIDKFSVVGTTIIGWLDNRLTWDPSQYNGVETFLVDNNVFWTPPIYLINSMDAFKKIGQAPYWTVRYYASGLGIFYPGDILSAHCRSNVRNFPWDDQSCFLAFSVISYLPNEIILTPFDEDAFYSRPLQYFIGDGIWDVKGREIGVANNCGTVTYKMKRKPLWAILNIILPIVLMAVLNILVFLIPSESGERISFCLTVLLAIAVFLTIVSDSMPKSATSIPYLSYYLASVLVLSILITVGTILSSKLYYADDDQNIPRCVQALVRCFLSKKRSTSGKNKNDRRHEHNVNNQDNTTSSSHSESHRRSSLSKSNTITLPVTLSSNMHFHVRPHMQADETRGVYTLPLKDPPKQKGKQNDRPGEPQMFYQSDGLKDTRAETLTWKHVSVAFDRIFFVISCLLVTGFTLAYFIVTSI